MEIAALKIACDTTRYLNISSNKSGTIDYKCTPEDT